MIVSLLVKNYDWLKLILLFLISLNYLNQYVCKREKRTNSHKLTDEEVYNLTRPDLSIKKNLELIREKWVRCKKDRLSRIIREKKQGMSDEKSLKSPGRQNK